MHSFWVHFWLLEPEIYKAAKTFSDIVTGFGPSPRPGCGHVQSIKLARLRAPLCNSTSTAIKTHPVWRGSFYDKGL